VRALGAAVVLVVLCVGPAVGGEAETSAARTALPAPLVYLRDLDASIVQDMRYAGPDNFTGAPVPGYAAPECILTRRTAEALSAVQRRLAERRLSLKVYDCYRPLKAVAAFMQWTNAEAVDGLEKRFHPALPRSRLVSQGYIAARSGHSRGNVVDLTLTTLPRPEVASFDPQKTYAACTAPAESRSPDDSLDMGTGFDCFDPRSHVGANALSPTQSENRKTLAAAMQREGFKPYDREWWHFSLPAGDSGRAFDVNVAPHP
jgi:D-alanyl-D-alanine dipeptidase